MDPQRLSCCSIPLRDRPWPQALSVIAAAGFAKVDLLGRAPHLTLDPAECDPAELKAAADALGIQIANLGTYVGRGFATEDPTALERELADFRRAVDIAVLVGARSIRVAPGNDQPAAIPHLAHWFRQGVAYAAERGIYLGFETHGGAISGDPAQALALCQAVGSPYFGVLYDPANLMHGGQDYRMALWTLREHITHVHFKDCAVGEGGYALTMLGEGQLDFRWIIERLEAWGYAGDYAVEFEMPAPAPEVALPLWRVAGERL
jgi:sugar phosphate isomerase/epimerase